MATKIVYILNPGDGCDVLVFEDRREAAIALERAFTANQNFAKLYQWNRGRLYIYDLGYWSQVEPGNVQNKVLDAARAAS